MEHTQTVDLVLLTNQIIEEMTPLLVNLMEKSNINFASHEIDSETVSRVQSALLLGLTKRHFESMRLTFA